MARPIQTIPQGLLGLLQLKQTGQNPTELLETVQPTYDLFPQFAERQAVETTVLFNGVTPALSVTAPSQHGQFGFGPAAVVPANQAWWVMFATIYLTGSIAAADTITAALAVGYPQTVGPYNITPAYQDVISSRARLFALPPIFRAFWLGPGAQFWMLVYDSLTAVGPYNYSLQVRAVPVPI